MIIFEQVFAERNGFRNTKINTKKEKNYEKGTQLIQGNFKNFMTQIFFWFSSCQNIFVGFLWYKNFFLIFRLTFYKATIGMNKYQWVVFFVTLTAVMNFASLLAAFAMVKDAIGEEYFISEGYFGNPFFHT